MKIKLITLSMVAAFTLGLMGCAGPMNDAATGAGIGSLGGALGNRQDKQFGNK